MHQAHRRSVPPWGPRAERRTEHRAPLLPRKLFPIDNHLQVKNHFFPSESHWKNKLLLRVGYMPSSRRPTENGLKGIFGGFLSQNVVSGLFFLMFYFYFILFSLFLPYRVCVYNMASSWCFYEISGWILVGPCTYICFLYLLLKKNLFLLIVGLSYSNLFLFCLILLLSHRSLFAF